MMGPIKKKVLLLLFGGIALGLSGSPRRYFKIMKGIAKEWAEINRQSLRNAITDLYRSRLVSTKENADGTSTFVLTEQGKKRALTYNIETMVIRKPTHWDRKWRIVIFDVPEKKKVVRESLRHVLHRLQFAELQKSVCVHPYPCQNEIEYVVEFYGARKYIRYMEATYIDNELHLMSHFGLM